jgi:hypothetical protein
MKSVMGARVGVAVGMIVAVEVADGTSVGVGVLMAGVEDNSGDSVPAGVQPARKASRSRVVRIRRWLMMLIPNSNFDS